MIISEDGMVDFQSSAPPDAPAITCCQSQGRDSGAGGAGSGAGSGERGDSLCRARGVVFLHACPALQFACSNAHWPRFASCAQAPARFRTLVKSMPERTIATTPTIAKPVRDMSPRTCIVLSVRCRTRQAQLGQGPWSRSCLAPSRRWRRRWKWWQQRGKGRGFRRSQEQPSHRLSCGPKEPHSQRLTLSSRGRVVWRIRPPRGQGFFVCC